jgi:hypothetical protein
VTNLDLEPPERRLFLAQALGGSLIKPYRFNDAIASIRSATHIDLNFISNVDELTTLFQGRMKTSTKTDHHEDGSSVLLFGDLELGKPSYYAFSGPADRSVETPHIHIQHHRDLLFFVGSKGRGTAFFAGKDSATHSGKGAVIDLPPGVHFIRVAANAVHGFGLDKDSFVWSIHRNDLGEVEYLKNHGIIFDDPNPSAALKHLNRPIEHADLTQTIFSAFTPQEAAKAYHPFLANP